MGATTVGSTAVDVVTAGRDCGARGCYSRSATDNRKDITFTSQAPE